MSKTFAFNVIWAFPANWRVGLFATNFFSVKNLKKGFPLQSLMQLQLKIHLALFAYFFASLRLNEN